MQFRKCVSGVGECGAQMGWEQFAELDHVLERISWFFPRHMSVSAQCLIVGMIHPDASVRITVAQSLEHPWLARGSLLEPEVEMLSHKLDLAYDSLEPPKSLLLELQQQHIKEQYHHGLSTAQRRLDVGEWGSPFVVTDEHTGHLQEHLEEHLAEHLEEHLGEHFDDTEV